MYCSLHGENTSNNLKDFNTLKSKGKAKPMFSKKEWMNQAREFILVEKKSSQENEKYLK